MAIFSDKAALEARQQAMRWRLERRKDIELEKKDDARRARRKGSKVFSPLKSNT